MDTDLTQIKVDFEYMPTGPWVARAWDKLVVRPTQHEVMGLATHKGREEAQRIRGMRATLLSLGTTRRHGIFVLFFIIAID
jgi:hypothetical protein